MKRSITRFAAESIQPARAGALIRAAAARAVERAPSLPLPAIELPARLEITFLTTDMAEMATWIRDVERTAPRAVQVRDEDPLRLYRAFVAIIALTRSLVALER